MVEKIEMLLKDKPLQVPIILISNYRKLKMTEQELLLTIVLLNTENLDFNPKEIATKLDYTSREVLELINSLCEKRLLELEVIKNGNKREERLKLDFLYQKLAFLIIDENQPNKGEFSNLFTCFEQEFGRTLSPMEYEYINGWLAKDYSEEIISLALKEAVYNGVSSLRYIDKILFEWKKKGVKTKEDVLRMQKRYRGKDVAKVDQEVFSYDWLNDTDE